MSKEGGGLQADENRKLYNELRAELLKRELAGSDNFDKSVLTLSSAGLGVSLAFLKDFGLGTVAVPGALYFSWGCFVMATLCTMASFLASMRAQGLQLSLAHRAYLEADDAAFDAPNPWNRWTVWLNHCAAFAFGLALVLTIFVVIYNMEVRRAMTSQTEQLMTDRRGATVPPLQRPVQPPPAPVPAQHPGSGVSR